MHIPEIFLPETKPETEWLRGRAVQKVSPQRDHARLQLALASRLMNWAEGRGEVGTEWRFRVRPEGRPIRPLVPDVSFVSAERLAPLSDEEIQNPLLAPDVAVEILSPGFRRGDLDDKIATLLCAGSKLVVIVDPFARRAELHDGAGVRLVAESGAIAHPALPGFSYPLAELFAALRRTR
jgi:Uma2 family endonuclease